MVTVKVQIKERDYPAWKWLLGLRYGDRKSLETLIGFAVNEIISMQARTVAETSIEISEDVERESEEG